MDCPYCHRPLYTRQYKHCGYCGKILPPECQFSPEEIAQHHAERREIEQRARLARENEIRENLSRSDSGEVF